MTDEHLELIAKGFSQFVKGRDYERKRLRKQLRGMELTNWDALIEGRNIDNRMTMRAQYDEGSGLIRKADVERMLKGVDG